jgi:hypothetical protein
MFVTLMPLKLFSWRPRDEWEAVAWASFTVSILSGTDCAFLKVFQVWIQTYCTSLNIAFHYFLQIIDKNYILPLKQCEGYRKKIILHSSLCVSAEGSWRVRGYVQSGHEIGNLTLNNPNSVRCIF